MRTIKKFHGEHRWLSSFSPAIVHVPLACGDSRLKGATVGLPTLEHGYVVMKAGSWTSFHNATGESLVHFVELTPGQAKRLGREVVLSSIWDEVKSQVMLGLLRQKFASPSWLGDMLMATEDAHLIEGNHWHDLEWGVCYCEKCGGQGKNLLGQLLMQVRGELNEEIEE